jgi:hypothetical protein
MELEKRLQNELFKLTGLACRSYTAVVLEDLAKVSDKIIAQSSKVARNNAEELQRLPYVWVFRSKKNDEASTPLWKQFRVTVCAIALLPLSACDIAQLKYFGILGLVCRVYPPPDIIEQLCAGAS